MAPPADFEKTIARVVEEAMRLGGEVTRTELAAACRKSLPTMSRAIAPVLGTLLTETAVIGDDKRPRKVVAVIRDALSVGGVKLLPAADRGSCRILGVAVDLSGAVVASTSAQATSTDPATVTAGCVEVATSLDRSLAAEGRPPLSALGVELGGHVDAKGGTVPSSPNLGWEPTQPPVDLRSFIEKGTGLLVTIQNDANALTLFEHLFGAGTVHRHFGVVLLSVGVGAGYFTSGTVAQGATGRAGEIGHIFVDHSPQPRLCRCGKEGCLETIVGEVRILERIGDPDIRTISAAVQLANDEPDGTAAKVFEEAGNVFGRAVAALCNTVDLAAVLVRHEGTWDARPFASAAEAAFRAHLFDSPDPGTIVLEGQRVSEVDGARGAAAAAIFARLRSGELIKIVRDQAAAQTS